MVNEKTDYLLQGYQTLIEWKTICECAMSYTEHLFRKKITFVSTCFFKWDYLYIMSFSDSTVYFKHISSIMFYTLFPTLLVVHI